MSNAAIFISYRRKDTAAHARAVYERLTERFGPERVFIDVSIPAGTDFVETIDETIRNSGAVVVVIGPSWLRNPTDAAAEMKPLDYVVFEVAAALEQKKFVIPVLVEEATMPAPHELPDGIKRLATIEALSISDERWDYDLARLCDRLEDVLPPTDGRAIDRGGGRRRTGERPAAPWRPRFRARWALAVGALVAAVIGAGIIVSSRDGDGSSDVRLGDRILTSRMVGDDVTELQLLLGNLGFNPGLPNGEFSDQTARAVIAFKTCWGEGLEPDTRVDRATVTALRTHGIVTGTNGNDRHLAGTSRGDIIFGRNGNDRISGLGGDDKLCGGEGVDTVVGGVGSDRLYGGADDDRLLGEEGDDTLIGFKGADEMDGGAGADACTRDSEDTTQTCER